jgi:hypothetical protein
MAAFFPGQVTRSISDGQILEHRCSKASFSTLHLRPIPTTSLGGGRIYKVEGCCGGGPVGDLRTYESSGQPIAFFVQASSSF